MHSYEKRHFISKNFSPATVWNGFVFRWKIDGKIISWVTRRVSFETSFDSKQPKLEPKLVSALSEKKRLFRLFRFYTETESFGVSIEPKQTEDQPKQFDREHIYLSKLIFISISG
jgi:hypothetical protein